MEESVSANLGATARGVVDVVALHGDQVRRASKVNGPVVMAVTGCGPAGGAVELAVGQGHSVGGTVASDEHLTTNERHLDVICLDVS